MFFGIVPLPPLFNVVIAYIPQIKFLT